MWGGLLLFQLCVRCGFPRSSARISDPLYGRRTHAPLGQCFSTGLILHPEDISGHRNLGCAACFQKSRGRDAVKQPTMHSKPPSPATKNDLVQNVSSAEADRRCRRCPAPVLWMPLLHWFREKAPVQRARLTPNEPSNNLSPQRGCQQAVTYCGCAFGPRHFLNRASSSPSPSAAEAGPDRMAFHSPLATCTLWTPAMACPLVPCCVGRWKPPTNEAVWRDGTIPLDGCC